MKIVAKISIMTGIVVVLIALNFTGCKTMRSTAQAETQTFHQQEFLQPVDTTKKVVQAIKPIIDPLATKIDQNISLTKSDIERGKEMQRMIEELTRSNKNTDEIKSSLSIAIKMWQEEHRGREQADKAVLAAQSQTRDTVISMNKIIHQERAARIEAQKQHVIERKADKADEDVSAKAYNTLLKVVVWGFFLVAAFNLLSTRYVTPYLKRKGLIY